MNYDNLSEEKPLMERAQKQIIYSTAWAADDTNGYITDQFGNIVDEVPKSSELFPDDREIPVDPVIVDPSYYGLND